jgi:hypothetical protein
MTQAPPRRSSGIGLYLLTAAFALFTLCAPAIWLALAKPWEGAPEPPPPDAGTDAGSDAGTDAGPPPPVVTNYRGTAPQAGPVTFGGRPYCEYSASFTELEVELTTRGVDDQGRPVAVSGRVLATYAEETSRNCPYPINPSNRHELAFTSAAYEGAELVVQYTSSGTAAPPSRATLRVTIAERVVDGTLALQRNDNFAPQLQFTMTSQVHLEQQ